jgi:hypothetical protein
LEFAKLFYDQNRTVPSVSIIIKGVQGINRTRLYRLFPRGLSEITAAAGIPPPPENRTEAVAKAMEARKKGGEQKIPEEAMARVQLTAEQSRRLFGICQLEGGIDPTLAIDRLLNVDSDLRRKYRLSLSKTKIVSDFIDSAVARGWKPDMIVDYISQLWNHGITNLNETVLRSLISLAQDIDLRFWGSVQDFIQYATKYYSRIGYFRAYLEGNVSLDQLLKAEGFQ